MASDPPPPYSHASSDPYGQGPTIMTQPGQSYLGPTTTVIIQQPAMTLPTHSLQQDWRTSVYNCCEDFPICLLGTFCTPCLMCKVACDMNESPFVVCCAPCPLMLLRTKWRADHNIRGSIMSDCCETCLLHDCVLCQLAREVKMEKKGHV